jgi:alpha-ketoglutarate-dependent taurine dioxygenase
MKVNSLNGGGVEILDADISEFGPEEYEEIKNIFADNLIVIFRNQSQLTIPFAKLVQGVGRIANYQQCQWGSDGRLLINKIDEISPFLYEGEDKFYPVQRVTAKVVDGKVSGIMGLNKLDWNTNMNGPFNRARGMAYQAIGEDVKGNSTSFLHTGAAYEGMSDSLKKRCELAVGSFINSPEIWAPGLSEEMYKQLKKPGEGLYEMPLLNLSLGKKYGLYFHINNQCSFPEDPELTEILKDHCFQDKFIYKHGWEAGDIVLSDQLLTLSKRDQTDPEVLKGMLLNRYSFHFHRTYNNQTI